jgi:hypothetical protein
MAKRDFHPNKNCPTRVGLAKKKKVSSSYKDISQLERAFTTSKVDHPQAQPHTHHWIYCRHQQFGWGADAGGGGEGRRRLRIMSVQGSQSRRLHNKNTRDVGRIQTQMKRAREKRIWKKSKRELPFTVDLVNTANPPLFRVLSGDAVTYHVRGGDVTASFHSQQLYSPKHSS